MSVPFKSYLHAALTFARSDSPEGLTEGAAPHWETWQEFVTDEPSDSEFSTTDRLKVLQIMAAPDYTVSLTNMGLVNRATNEVITDLNTVAKTIGTSPNSSIEEFSSVSGIIANLVAMMKQPKFEKKFNEIKAYLAQTGRKIPFEDRAFSQLDRKKWQERSAETNKTIRDLRALSSKRNV